MDRAVIIIAAAGILSFLLFGGWRAFEPTATVEIDRPPSYAAARSACRRYTRDRLHDPSRADWMDWRNWHVIPTTEGATVHMTFRGTNAMGALIMVSRECRVATAGRDWRVVGVDQR